MTEAINLATMCNNGSLPVCGGLLDQSSWFLELWQCLQREQGLIESEQAERIRNG